jgi:hypothetical protein
MVMEYSPQFSSLIRATFGEEDEVMTRICPKVPIRPTKSLDDQSWDPYE